MEFRYLKDPLFIACFAAYWLNWLLEEHQLSLPILQFYLNDLICVPFWIPIMLCVQRGLRLRCHDAPPLAYEIIIPMVIWAALFEILLPVSQGWTELAVADPNDVVCYAFGGLAATFFWSWWYRDCSQPVSRPMARMPQERLSV